MFAQDHDSNNRVPRFAVRGVIILAVTLVIDDVTKLQLFLGKVADFRSH